MVRFVTLSGKGAEVVLALDQAGRLAEEIVPVRVPQKRGADREVGGDEHPRPETTLADLEKLKAISKAINKTAYYGGIGLDESGKYLGLLDRIIVANGGTIE